MITSKFKRFGLPTALVVGGVTAGSFLAPIGLASAQQAVFDADADQTEESETESETEGRHRHRGHRGERADVVAETLGLTGEEIRQGFEDGKSLADMAGEQGIAYDDLRSALMDSASQHLDEAVAAGRLDESEAAEKLAELDAKIDEHLTTVPDLSQAAARRHRHLDFHIHRHLHRHHQGHHHGHRGVGTLEDALGLSGEEIRAGLAEGKTLADLAEEQGVAVEDLADQLIASMEERLDQAVEEGHIDEERADEIRDGLEEKVDERLNSEFDGNRGRGRGHNHRGLRGAADADSESDVENTAEV